MLKPLKTFTIWLKVISDLIQWIKREENQMLNDLNINYQSHWTFYKLMVNIMDLWIFHKWRINKKKYNKVIDWIIIKYKLIIHIIN